MNAPRLTSKSHYHINSAIHLVNRSLTIFLGIVFIAAAIGKALDGSTFLAAILYLSPISLRTVHAFRLIIYSMIIFIECFFGICLILSCHPSRPLLYAVLFLLLAFTVILIYMALDPWAPNCGCLGLLRIASKSDNNARIGIVRNIGLMLICISLIWNSYSPQQ